MDRKCNHRKFTDVRAESYRKLFDASPTRIFPSSDFVDDKDEKHSIDIYVYALRGTSGDLEVAVTNGMSDQRMIDPGDSNHWSRRELIEYFPKCTAGHAERLHDMAWVPLFDGFLIDTHHTMWWNRSAVAGTPWTEAFFLDPIIKNHRQFTMDVDGDPVSLLWHIPISEMERKYKQQNGANALIHRMQEINLPWIFDEANRPPLATEQDVMVTVFIPPLVTLLLHAEKQKGAALSKAEVIKIRDKSPCITMSVANANKLGETRGYRDVDPENVWSDWQMFRDQKGFAI
jgi:hypothetical protein